MGFIKLKCSIDNTLNSYYPKSNQGFNPILDVYAKIKSSSQKEISRSILKFDLTDLNNALQNNLFSLTSNSVTAICKLYNVFSNDVPPSQVVYDIHKLRNDWQEGIGLNLSSTGYSNWYQNSVTSSWNVSGADYSSIALTSINLEVGNEDLVFDIKNQLIDWTTGTNYGIIVKLQDQYESVTSSLSATEYYAKRFFGRSTKSIFEPRIEIIWNDKFEDNSNNLMFGQTGNLYFYNKTSNVYVDLNGTSGFPGYLGLTGNGLNSSVTTSLSSVTSIVLDYVPGNRISTGIYKFNLPTISYSAATLSAIYSVWTITSSLSAAVPKITKPITIKSPIIDESLNFNLKFKMAIANFQDRVKLGDKFNYSVFFTKQADTLQTLTSGSTALNSYIATNGYWKVIDDRTGVDVYPWDYLSYNNQLNFFEFDSKYLQPQRPYRLAFKIIEGDRIYQFSSPEYYFNFYLYQ
jgi:hypothetical protein